MAKPECRWKCPDRWSEWSEWLAAGLHARNHWRLPVLLVGILFATGRRTVTSWLRAAGVSDDFRDEWHCRLWRKGLGGSGHDRRIRRERRQRARHAAACFVAP